MRERGLRDGPQLLSVERCEELKAVLEQEEELALLDVLARLQQLRALLHRRQGLDRGSRGRGPSRGRDSGGRLHGVEHRRN